MVTLKVTARLGGTKGLGYNRASQFSYLYLLPALSLQIFLVLTAISASQLSSTQFLLYIAFFSSFLTLSFYLFLSWRIQPGLVYQSPVPQIPEVEDCLILSDMCSYLPLFSLLQPNSLIPLFLRSPSYIQWLISCYIYWFSAQHPEWQELLRRAHVVLSMSSYLRVDGFRVDCYSWIVMIASDGVRAWRGLEKLPS